MHGIILFRYDGTMSTVDDVWPAQLIIENHLHLRYFTFHECLTSIYAIRMIYYTPFTTWMKNLR